MATTITMRPTATISTGSGWSNPSNVYDNNKSTYAQRTTSGKSSTSFGNFSPKIPENATVDEVRYYARYYANNSRGYLKVSLTAPTGKSGGSGHYLNGASQTSAIDGLIRTAGSYMEGELLTKTGCKNAAEFLNGLTVTFEMGSTSSSLSSTVRLYEFWIEVDYTLSPYTVSFNGNGATSGSVSSLSKNVGESFVLPDNPFSKKYNVTLNQNYSGSKNSSLTSSASFIGWEDRGDITSTSGEKFSASTFDAPLYANTYGDLYNAFGYNKLNLVNHYVSNGRAEIADGRRLPKIVMGSTPRGTYPQGATVSNLTDAGGTCTLYAQWSAMPAVTLPTPTRDGYTFLGWFTSSEGGSKVGDGGASYTPTGNVMLYAQWEQLVKPPQFTSVEMIYGGEQISKTNKVIAEEGFRIIVGVS